MAGIQQVSFTSPYAAEEADIERRRKMAELLQAKGQEPFGPTEQIGGWAIPRSPWEVAGKAAQQVSGAYQQKGLREREKALTAQSQADALRWYGDQPSVGMKAQPTDQEGTGAFDMGGAQTPQAPGMPGKQEMMGWLLRGQANPASAPLAQAMMAQLLKGPGDLIGKVDVDKFTAASVAKFAQTGNHADLVPRDKQEQVHSVGPTGQPITSFVNPYQPPAAGVAAPMPGFLGQLQSLGILQPGMEKDPRVQQILSGYLGKETGQITPAMAAELAIKLGHLRNEGTKIGLERQGVQFNTGGVEMGGGAAVPQAPAAFNAFGGNASTQNLGAPINAPQAAQGAPSGPQPVQRPPMLPQPVPAPVAAPKASSGPIIDQVTPKERQALLVAKPHAEAGATSSIQNIDRMSALAKELHDHKRLSGVTGKVNQYSVGDVFPETRAARGLQDALVNQVGIQALQAMRDASKTGGAVGNVTEKEWPILQQSIAALSAAQGTADYQKALVNLQTQIGESSKRIRQAYESTYGPLTIPKVAHVTQGRSADPRDAALGAKPFADPEQERRYQDWKARNGG